MLLTVVLNWQRFKNRDIKVGVSWSKIHQHLILKCYFCVIFGRIRKGKYFTVSDGWKYFL